MYFFPWLSFLQWGSNKVSNRVLSEIRKLATHETMIPTANEKMMCCKNKEFSCFLTIRCFIYTEKNLQWGSNIVTYIYIFSCVPNPWGLFCWIVLHFIWFFIIFQSSKFQFSFDQSIMGWWTLHMYNLYASALDSGTSLVCLFLFFDF